MSFFKYILLILSLLQISFCIAQEKSSNDKIKVENFRHDPMDLTAKFNAVELDQNGDKAALIKIETTQRGFRFDTSS